MKNTTLVSSLVLSLSLVLGGCAAVGTPMNDAAVPVQSADFMGQTQLPAGTKILYDQRVMLDMGKDSMAAYTFFLEQYPQQGWTLLSAISGKTSLLVFTKQDRSATVEMHESNMLSGTLVTLTVTPKNAAVSLPKK